MGDTRPFDKSQRFQMLERGDHLASGIAEQARNVLGTDEAGLMEVQKDQHIPGSRSWSVSDVPIVVVCVTIVNGIVMEGSFYYSHCSRLC